ncbi:hypothetical protein EV361DRAFT_77842 [Lentinula raphanica]|nr:hypothetical protein EV361DRAFT_77842 [Lentinula raphanica]
MRLLSLILEPPFVDNQVQTLHLPGLKAIHLHMYSEPVSFTWLPQLSLTHPTLNELWLFEIYHNFFTHDAPPFVSSLVKEYQRQNYQDPFVISAVGLRRAKANGLSSQEWLVTEITMRTGHLLTNNLSLLASSFPELEVLRLNFDSDLGKYDNFSYLRVVHIVDIVRRLPFGSEIENRMRPGQQVETTPTLHEIRVGAERELLAFISCVAKQVRTLDLVYIDDAGSGYDDDEEYIQLWGFKGWLHVLNSKRVIGGMLALDHTI